MWRALLVPQRSEAGEPHANFSFPKVQEPMIRMLSRKQGADSGAVA